MIGFLYRHLVDKYEKYNCVKRTLTCEIANSFE